MAMLDEAEGRFHHPLTRASAAATLEHVPSALRARVALFALVASFLIPVFLSSLRGLTHVLTCRQQVATPFRFQIVPGAEPIQLASPGGAAPQQVCGGLSVDVFPRSAGESRIAIEVPIRNDSDSTWHGTVLLRLGNIDLPVNVGKVESGSTGSDTLVVDLDPGLHEVSGSLLIGP
jgi:hypothetical protein